MALFAMSDLHLAISNPDKSMEHFGSAWSNYMPRIKEGFEANVTSEDTVLMPGDLSWVMYLRDGYDDFKFIEDLPGHKIISRGNHDYFWTTVKKLEETFKEFGFNTIEVARNNIREVDNTLITGTRGWMMPFEDGFKAEDQKIYDREIIRLGLCLNALKEADPEHTKRHIIMLHYPPLNKVRKNTDFTRIMEESGIVDMCIYGHLHGKAQYRVFEGENNGIMYRCVAADYLKFIPANLDEEFPKTEDN